MGLEAKSIDRATIDTTACSSLIDTYGGATVAKLHDGTIDIDYRSKLLSLSTNATAQECIYGRWCTYELLPVRVGNEPIARARLDTTAKWIL